MNAVVTSIKRERAQTAQSKLLRDAGQGQRPEAEPTLTIEAVRARAKTVTLVLEDILRSGIIRAGGNMEAESRLSDAAIRGAVQPGRE